MNGITGLGVVQQLTDSTRVLDVREKRFFNNVLEQQVFPATGGVSDQIGNEPGESVLDVSEKRYFNRLLNASLFQPTADVNSSEALGETVLDQKEKLYFNTLLHADVFPAQNSATGDQAQASAAERVLDTQERRYFKSLAQFEADDRGASALQAQDARMAAAKGGRINVKL